MELFVQEALSSNLVSNGIGDVFCTTSKTPAPKLLRGTEQRRWLLLAEEAVWVFYMIHTCPYWTNLETGFIQKNLRYYIWNWLLCNWYSPNITIVYFILNLTP